MTKKPTSVNDDVTGAKRTTTALAPSDSDSQPGGPVGHSVVCACKTRRVNEVLPLATLAATAKQPCISTQCGVNFICT